MEKLDQSIVFKKIDLEKINLNENLQPEHHLIYVIIANASGVYFKCLKCNQ